MPPPPPPVDPPGSRGAGDPERARRRRQVGHARYDRTMRLVERAARAAEEGDATALTRLAERMAAAATDAVDGHHPPSRALDFLLCDAVASLAPHRGGPAGPEGDRRGAEEPWDAALVRRAERDLSPAAARWVRAAAVTVAGGAVIEGAAVGGNLVDGLAASDGRPGAELFRDGVLALAWLRGYARDLVARAPPPPVAGE